MINPVIYTFHLFGYNFPLRWYGVIVMIGVVVGSLMIEKALKRHGENSDTIWDALVLVLPVGILGARLWYVANATLGGNHYYMENPIQIINIPQGGLHIFGAFLFGAAALLIYLNKNKLDVWLFLDAIGPAALIGQGIGRIANFINQELYGPPTDLPWGIKIEAQHRLPDFQGLSEATRFHPTFAYEMLWNFTTAGILLWLSKRYEKQIKPGTIFAGWLIAAGFGRVFIEFFRPDQPKIAAWGISYTTIVSALMAITGAVLLMARYKAINLSVAEDWEEEYKISTQPNVQEASKEIVELIKKAPRVKKVSKPASKAVVVKKPSDKKTVAKKTTPKKKASTPAKKPAK